MDELVTNLHIHTSYSDGHTTHAGLVRAALNTRLDVLIVTDHNVLVNGLEGFYKENDREVLLLIGEEIHDQSRLPQRNHLLVLGAGRELSTHAPDPQRLIQLASNAGGLTFIAHPCEDALPLFGETAITWDDWNINGYTGIELWNGLSELKSVVHNRLGAIFFGLFPQFIAEGPKPELLAKWDQLLISGKRIVAVGGSDAHALRIRMGPFKRTVFPYEFHFNAINTHLLTPHRLTGDLPADRRMVYDALRRGSAFIGYDLPAPTNGFRFHAQGKECTVGMGEEIALYGSVTLQARLPQKCECRLIRNGEIIKSWHDRDICAYIANQPGVYRIECYLPYLGKPRGWIFSNPIFIRNRNTKME